MVPNADEGRGARANAGGPIGRARLIARVAADAARVPSAGRPGGTLRLLHGAPRVYYSAYDSAFLSTLAAALRGSAAEEVWCIFDNTASGAATANALTLQMQLGPFVNATNTIVTQLASEP
jgi:uncharacterized protein YecE (DUF72 family)